MKTKDKKNTNICAFSVDFEYLEIPPELAAAKHARIMKIFAGALLRARSEEAARRSGSES